ncbi:MAG: hypothetical protein ACOCV2_14105 [Persicimonas sp.]
MFDKRLRLASLIGLLVILSMALQACTVTKNRVIRQSFQSGDDRIKFLYEESVTNERGVLECRVSDSGQLEDCKELNLVFGDEEEE